MPLDELPSRGVPFYGLPSLLANKLSERQKKNKRLNKITILSRSCCDKKKIFIYFSAMTFLFLMHLSCSRWKHLCGKKGLGRKERKRKCPAVYTPLNLHVVLLCIFIMCLYAVCVCMKRTSRMRMYVSEASAGSGTALPFKLPPFMSPPVPRHPDPTQKNAISRKII